MEKQLAMPRLRPEMTSGVLCAWLKEEGDTVEAGDVLLESSLSLILYLFLQ